MGEGVEGVLSPNSGSMKKPYGDPWLCKLLKKVTWGWGWLSGLLPGHENLGLGGFMPKTQARVI